MDLPLGRATQCGRPDQPDGRTRKIHQQSGCDVFAATRKREIFILCPIARSYRKCWPIFNGQRTIAAHSVFVQLCRSALENPETHPHFARSVVPQRFDGCAGRRGWRWNDFVRSIFVYGILPGNARNAGVQHRKSGFRKCKDSSGKRKSV